MNNELRLLNISEKIASDSENYHPGDSILTGYTKNKVKNYLQKIFEKYTHNKMYRDNNWAPVHDLLNELRVLNIDVEIVKTEYMKNDDGTPISKRWDICVSFINDKGKEIKLYGPIVASGAGSIKEPLDRYDLVVYVS